MEEKDFDLNEFMNTEDIAKILRKNIATIQRWCRDGELPAAKLGRTYMVRKTDFESWYKEKISKRHQHIPDNSSENEVSS
jgi:excisionase family DNA binding protein